VGKGTVYLYFSGKEEVLLTLVVEVKRAITERMRDIAASPDLLPVEKLRRMMQARILAVYDAATSTTHGKELVDTIRPQICQCGRDQYEAQVRLVADLLREGDGSVFDVPDPERTALLFTTAFESFFPPYICSAFPVERTRAELEAGTAEMVDFLVRGLRRSGGDGGS
jgi:AcrR family transcriptional regulator